MGKKSRRKRERRASPPPPVGKQPSSWRQRRQLIVLAGAVVAAGGLAAGLGIALSSSSRAGVKLAPLSSLPANIPGLDVDEPPWPAEHTRLGSRLDALGFPRLQMEAEVLHIHQHLDIYVNGHHATVSALIGIDAQENFISPVHTHDATGIIHIESPVNYDYTLGQFFDVWGVRFTPRCIGGLCAGAGRQLRVYVNGKLVVGDLRLIVLQSHQEIVVAYGTPAQLPDPVPSRYDFPAGL